MAKRIGSRRSGQVPVWLVVLIVIVLVAIGIYLIVQANRRTSNVEAQSRDQINELQQQLGAAEARFRLSTLRADLQAGVDSERLQAQYNDIRDDLENAYADAQGQAAEAWNSVQEDLDALGDQIAEGSQEAVATIGSVLERLSGTGNQ